MSINIDSLTGKGYLVQQLTEEIFQQRQKEFEVKKKEWIESLRKNYFQKAIKKANKKTLNIWLRDHLSARTAYGIIESSLTCVNDKGELVHPLLTLSEHQGIEQAYIDLIMEEQEKRKKVRFN